MTKPKPVDVEAALALIAGVPGDYYRPVLVRDLRAILDELTRLRAEAKDYANAKAMMATIHTRPTHGSLLYDLSCVADQASDIRSDRDEVAADAENLRTQLAEATAERDALRAATPGTWWVPKEQFAAAEARAVAAEAKYDVASELALAHDAEVARLRAQWDERHTCFVCEASLMPDDHAPHCEDCHVDDDRQIDWDARAALRSEPAGEEAKRHACPAYGRLPCVDCAGADAKGGQDG